MISSESSLSSDFPSGEKLLENFIQLNSHLRLFSRSPGGNHAENISKKKTLMVSVNENQ